MTKRPPPTLDPATCLSPKCAETVAPGRDFCPSHAASLDRVRETLVREAKWRKRGKDKTEDHAEARAPRCRIDGCDEPRVPSELFCLEHEGGVGE